MKYVKSIYFEGGMKKATRVFELNDDDPVEKEYFKGPIHIDGAPAETVFEISKAEFDAIVQDHDIRTKVYFKNGEVL